MVPGTGLRFCGKSSVSPTYLPHSPLPPGGPDGGGSRGVRLLGRRRGRHPAGAVEAPTPARRPGVPGGRPKHYREKCLDLALGPLEDGYFMLFHREHMGTYTMNLYEFHINLATL